MKSKYAVIGTLFVLAAASMSADREGGTRGLFRLPTGAGVPSVPRVLWLAIDTRALPLRKNLTLFLTKPQVRREPVLGPSTSPDAPDNVAAYLYGTVLHEAGKFRMCTTDCTGLLPRAESGRARSAMQKVSTG